MPRLAFLLICIITFVAFSVSKACSLSWASVGDADDYDIYYGSSKATVAFVATTSQTSRTCSQIGIANPVNGYFFAVQASNEGGNSSSIYVQWRKSFGLIGSGAFVNLDTSTTVYSEPSQAKPAYLASYTDATFGTKVTRVTGDDGNAIPNTSLTWTDVARHFYSKVSAWSANDEMIMVIPDLTFSGGKRVFLDGNTYQVLFSRDIGDNSYGNFRWHPTQPKIAFFTDGNQLKSINVSTGQETVEGTFSGYDSLDFGQWEGNFTHDGNKVVLLAYIGNDKYAFLYDLSTDTVGDRLVIGEQEIDWVSASPSGEHVVVVYSDTNMSILDPDFASSRAVFVPMYHSDMGVDNAGREIMSAGLLGDYEGVSGYGTISLDLINETFTRLDTGTFVEHTSMRNTDLPGWIYVSHNATSTDELYGSEITSVSTRGGLIRRWVHHQNTPGLYPNDYFSETHACPSRDCTKVLFASAWGETDGRPVNSYVVELQ